MRAASEAVIVSTGSKSDRTAGVTAPADLRATGSRLVVADEDARPRDDGVARPRRRRWRRWRRWPTGSNDDRRGALHVTGGWSTDIEDHGVRAVVCIRMRRILSGRRLSIAENPSERMRAAREVVKVSSSTEIDRASRVTTAADLRAAGARLIVADEDARSWDDGVARAGRWRRGWGWCRTATHSHSGSRGHWGTRWRRNNERHCVRAAWVCV